MLDRSCEQARNDTYPLRREDSERSSQTNGKPATVSRVTTFSTKEKNVRESKRKKNMTLTADVS